MPVLTAEGKRFTVYKIVLCVVLNVSLKWNPSHKTHTRKKWTSSLKAGAWIATLFRLEQNTEDKNPTAQLTSCQALLKTCVLSTNPPLFLACCTVLTDCCFYVVTLQSCVLQPPWCLSIWRTLRTRHFTTTPALWGNTHWMAAQKSNYLNWRKFKF